MKRSVCQTTYYYKASNKKNRVYLISFNHQVLNCHPKNNMTKNKLKKVKKRKFFEKPSANLQVDVS